MATVQFIQAKATTLSVGISAAETGEIILKRLVDIYGTDIAFADFGTIGYVTISPGGDDEEIISFTGFTRNSDDTVSLNAGITRAVSAKSGSATTGTASAHAAGAVVVVSNNPQLYTSLVSNTGNETIEGVKTFTSSPVVPTPVNNTDAANLAYVNSVVAGIATTINVLVPGTAGETVAAGNLVYFDDTDNEWKLCDADTASTVENVMLGIAQGAGTNGNSISGGVLLRGLDANQTGLTAGAIYYASNTGGAISSSAGTKEVTVGFSYSTTQLYFNPRFNQQLTEDQQDLIEKFLLGTDWYAAASSGSDSYAVTLSPAPTAYATGMRIRFRTDVANTGACSLNVNGLGARDIKKHNDQDLETGDLEANMIVEVVYDGLSGQFKMVSQTASSPTGGVFGNGADGDVTISVDTSLSRDMYYNNLTIGNGFTLNPNGFRVFVKGTLTCTGTGKIASNGIAGGNGATQTAGTAGAVAYSTGSLPVPLIGEPGGAGNQLAGVGAGGDPGVAQAKALGEQNSVAGGTGGTGDGGTGTGGAGGAAANSTGTKLAYPSCFISAYNLFDLAGGTITQFGVAPSSGGGGGGGGSTGGYTIYGGGGGGSGSSGGVVWISAYSISTLNAEAIGGTGGNGGNSGLDGSYRCGVGGGGAGGNGGVIILIYKSATTVNTTVTGGTGGAIGTLGNKTNATAGTNGNVGKVYTITV